MIRINQIKLPIGHTDEQLQQQICKTLKIRADQLLELHLVKKSIDAREKATAFLRVCGRCFRPR